MMKWSGLTLILTGMAGWQAMAAEPPVQVIYRFDEHRTLELKGWNCEGALWFIDTRRGIRSEVASQFYRLFTGKFVHPSEQYIAITDYTVSGILASKDYGRTWRNPLTLDHPRKEEVESFTVVNNQGFMQMKDGSLYLSSLPFDDPRLAKGGPGIHYVDSYFGDKHHIRPESPGPAWGMQYVWLTKLNNHTAGLKTNWQNLPEGVPEVKDYKGWDHMRCNPDAGLE